MLVLISCSVKSLNLEKIDRRQSTNAMSGMDVLLIVV